MKKGMNKKGLSDVVTTVLIILFAIVAVAVVGGIVLNQINKAGKNIDKAQVCTSNKISPISCVQDGSNVLIGYQYKSKSQDVSGVSSITASFESNDGGVTSTSIDPAGLTLGGAATSIVGGGVSGALKNVKLATTFTTTGGDATCNSESLNCQANLIPQQGLIGYWNFDLSSLDESTGKNLPGSWIVSGAPAPTYLSGVQGQYLNLNNLGYIDIPLAAGGSGLAGNAISVCSWVNFDTIASPMSEQQILYIQVPGASQRFIYQSTYTGTGNNNGIHFGTLTSTGTWGRSAQSLTVFTTASTWYHVCGTFNSTNGQTINYVNGAQNVVTTNPTGSAPGTPSNIYLGSSHPEGAGSRKLDGSIDEVMVYNRVLTAQEITNIYNAQRPKLI